jgi:hypothetical protein
LRRGFAARHSGFEQGAKPKNPTAAKKKRKWICERIDHFKKIRKFWENMNFKFLKLEWKQTERILRIIEVIAIVSGVIFAVVQIRDLRNDQSAQLMLEFNKELNSNLNANLITAIEDNKPLLKDNGGEFSTTDIDRYLGVYELLNTVSITGLINDDMLYNAFAYDILKTYNNQEIKNYLTKIRQEDSSFFRGVDVLAEDLLKSKIYRKNNQ